MSSTPHFAMQDTTRPDGCYVQLVRKIIEDDDNQSPDERDQGFWPSLDKDSPGYIGPNPKRSFADQMADTTARMEAFKRGEWGWIGVRAVANVFVVTNGIGIHFSLESPGLFGTESDADESYLNEIYETEVSILKDMIAALASPQFEES